MKTSRIELAHYIATESQKSRLPKNFAAMLAGYLLAEHSSGELERIMRDVQDIRFENGYIEAIIQSARALNAETKTKAMQLLKRRYPKAKHIAFVEVIDESLIGGIAILLPDVRLDLSVSGRIRTFRRAVAERVAA